MRALAVVLSAVAIALAASPAAAASASADGRPRALGFDADAVVPRSDEARTARDRLQLTPADRARNRGAGTWGESFDRGSVENRAPLLFWVLALVAIGVLGFPFAWLAARGLPDGGVAFARPLGLLIVAWATWWLASAEVAPFTRGLIGVVAAALAAVGAALLVRRRRELHAWLAGAWRVVAVEEAVFWLLFAGFLAVRWLNPDLWHPTRGGEKPMDFAFLNAVLKSPHFPPFDPWFADGYINYYYFGFVLVAVLVKATAIVPAVAYNLAVPTFAAMLGAGAYGVTLALVQRRRERVSRATLVAGVLAAVFVVVIGNLGEVEVLLDAIRGSVPTDWWYWNASRAISHPAEEPGPITEFPAFTFLYADLHAHALALPYAATALGLALAVLRAPGRRAAAVAFALLALTLGALWATNAWDVPTYGALAVGILVLAARRPGRRAAAWALRAGAAGVGLWLLAYALFLPFHTHYRSVFNGVERWHGSQTSLRDYLTIHGFFLFLIASALVADLLRSADAGALARTVRLVVRTRRPRQARRLLGRLGHPSAAYRLAVVSLVTAVVGAIAAGIVGGPVTALIAVLLILAVVLLQRRPALAGAAGSPDRRWQATLLLVIAGLVLTLVVEHVVVSGIDIGRNNTVFKTYLQVWLLWSVAAAVSAHRLYGQLRRWPLGAGVSWRVAFVGLFAAALLYPALAVPARVRDRFVPSAGATLDGEAFMRRAVHFDHDRRLPLVYDLEAIRWLQEHLRGSPVVLEVNTYPTLYGWGNRYAMFTGNPAVVGWDFHERQQRELDAPEVQARIADVQEAYRTTSPRRAFRLLHRYGVEYVVVGELERAYFPDGQDKWDEAAGRLWRRVYANPGVDVYRVIRNPEVAALRGRAPPGTPAS